MAEQYTNPCGPVIMGRNATSADILEHVKKANYEAILALDAQELASKLNQPYNVFRAYTFEPHPVASLSDSPADYKRQIDNDAERLFNNILPWAKQYPNTHIYINNEQSFTKQRLDMYAALMRRIVLWSAHNDTKPFGLVMGNFASGGIKCGQGPRNIIQNGKVIHENDNSVLPSQEELERGWREVNEWLSKGEDFLRTMHQYRNEVTVTGAKAFILGDHQYTTFTPWFSSDGGDYQGVFNWRDRPKSIDWKKAQWHIGRTVQGVMQVCKQWGITLPWMMITESLMDTMNDVINRVVIKLPPGVQKPRGFKTYSVQWPLWFPEFANIFETYAEMQIWTWETVYAPLGNIIAALNFGFGNTGDWWTFDTSVPSRNDYLLTMEDYRWIPLPPEVELPLPDNAGDKVKATVSFPAATMNVRKGNSVFYSVKGVIANNSILEYYPSVNVNGWTYVVQGDLKGWMSLQSGQVVFTPINTEPEPTKKSFDVVISFTGTVLADSLEDAQDIISSGVRISVTPTSL